MADHTCPAKGCDRTVPRSALACRDHWFSVPKPMRDELWAAYRDAGMGSARHSAAVTAIVSWFGDQ